MLIPPVSLFCSPSLDLASPQTAELEQASSIRSQKAADEKKVQEKIDAAVEAHKVSRSFVFFPPRDFLPAITIFFTGTSISPMARADVLSPFLTFL